MEVKIAKNIDEINLCYQLRDIIFIQGQNVPKERERDNEDGLATHFLLFKNKTPIGVGRIVVEKNLAKVGRLGILDTYIGNGAGFFLMNSIISHCREIKIQKIELGAQEHAVEFYKRLDFEVCSNKYMDANIPHFKMQLGL